MGRRESLTSVSSYIRRQAAIAAAFNVVLNPLFLWLGNRETDFMPLWGSDGLARNNAASSVILSLLVALFAAAGLHRELRGGRMALDQDSPRAGGLLAQLPGRAWLLGLLLGLGAALLLTFALWLLDALGASGLSFAGSMVFTAVYCGGLAYLVARWVILRQIAGETGSA